MILYINGNYPHHSLHRELVYKLAEMGNDIIVFVPIRGKKNEGLYPCNHSNARIIYSDCLNCADRVFFLLKIKKIAKIIEQQVNMSKVDCILAGTVYSDGAVAYRLHKKFHIPFSVAVRETDVTYQMRFRPYLNGYIKKLLNQTIRMIFLSPTYQRYFAKYGIEQRRISIIPNAVNDYWFQQEKKARVLHDPCSLIFVGEISKRKNVSTTIRAVAELAKKGIKMDFHIIGSGAEEGKCHALAEELNIEKQIFFHGWQNGKENIKEFYDQSDVFIMLSRRETFGTVYIEALSQGIPLIYTKGQGIDGYFEKGYIGFACDPNDPIEVANAIQEILSQYNQISGHCFRAAEKFHWETVAEQYDCVIKDMLRK